MAEFKKIGRYQIEGRLGSGTYADVYRAKDTVLDNIVALKVLKPKLMADTDAVGRFFREAKTAAALFHPRIALVLNLGDVEGYYFIAMRYVEGSSLDKVIQSRGALPWLEAFTIFEQVADGLSFVHERGLVHRDVKPQNIILSPTEGAVLTDFGLVRAVEASQSFSGSLTVLGTPEYMAPEIWNEETAGPATDQYALACVLVEMLSGKSLFKAKTSPAIMKKHFDPLQLPETWPDGTPHGIGAILEKALDKDPARRYGRIREFVQSLRALPVPEKAVVLSVQPEPRRMPSPDEPVEEDALPLQSAASSAPLQRKTINTFSSENTASIFQYACLHTLQSEVDFSFCPVEKFVALSNLHKIQIFDLCDLTKRNEFDLPSLTYHLVYSPDGKLIATTHWDFVRIWRASDGNLLRELKGPGGADSYLEMLKGGNTRARSIAFSPDGKLIAAAGWDGTIRLWLAEDGSLLREVRGNSAGIGSTVLSWDGSLMAAGSADGKITVWLNPGENRLYEIQGHRNNVESLAFSPDGKLIASGSRDHTVQLWQTSDGSPQMALQGHHLQVARVAFSPDGSILASASWDGTIRLWRARDGLLLRELTDPSGLVMNLAFSPDGKFMASSSLDGALILWAIKS